MMKKLILVLPVVLAAAIASATASSAEPSPVRTIEGYGLAACPASSFCLYQDADFNGSRNASIWVITETIWNLNDYGINDVASSAYLNEPSDGPWATLYAEPHGRDRRTGDYVKLYPGKSLKDFHDVGGYDKNDKPKRVWLNDAISSVMIG